MAPTNKHRSKVERRPRKAPTPARSPPTPTLEAALAKMVVEGLVANAMTATNYSEFLGEVELAEGTVALMAETQRAKRGDLGNLEAMLAAQAVALNAMFTQLASKASRMTLVDQIDRFTRLALKAQSQCRATIETLAVIKNPTPAIFARQANIAQGPQQINNGAASAASRAELGERAQIKVLEAHGERLDLGAAKTASGSDPAMVPVEPLDGTKDA